MYIHIEYTFIRLVPARINYFSRYGYMLATNKFGIRLRLFLRSRQRRVSEARSGLSIVRCTESDRAPARFDYGTELYALQYYTVVPMALDILVLHFGCELLFSAFGES